MNKQRMIKVLEDAKGAVEAAGFGPGHTELVGQLILASAIEEVGSSVSLSLDKLEGVALELGDVAKAIRMIAANLPGVE